MYTTYILSFVAGYLFFLYLSSPKKFKNKIPKLGLGRVQLFPSFVIKIGKIKFHIHHWIYLSIILFVYIFSSEKTTLSSQIFKGYLVGGIFQGISYPDKLRIIKRVGSKNLN